MIFEDRNGEMWEIEYRDDGILVKRYYTEEELLAIENQQKKEKLIKQIGLKVTLEEDYTTELEEYNAL